MERSVKSVELTCNRQPTTTTHDIPPVLARLPQDWEITEDLQAAWATVPSMLRVYTAILYRGLNQHTGTTFNELLPFKAWAMGKEQVYNPQTLFVKKIPMELLF